MPLAEVHFLFTMLKMPYVLVTRKGRLMGVITKETLIQEHFKQEAAH
jgi:predicted transcriptional regulator